ncbi:calnexin homolog isoform X2 [Papaver somniferum]|uniref:calnexin homolog isoform X2 n=1 Tax=Papaver somniferum TaxID=3469 RepID=UPI000E6FF06B|nr:calnexin homolog isoform X2 [Papaver somniferum]
MRNISEFQKRIFEVLYKFANLPFLADYKIKDNIEKGEKQLNITIGILVSVALVILTSIGFFLAVRKQWSTGAAFLYFVGIGTWWFVRLLVLIV